MKKFYYCFPWLNYILLHIIPLLSIIQVHHVEVEAKADVGSIKCVDGKWKVDTKLMALIMTCPLPLDGNADSVMKMVKCAMNKLGIYDGEDLSDDFTDTVCTIFGHAKLKEDCLGHANTCAFVSGIRFSWELTWPAFATCFIPWIMSICNI